MSAVLSPTFLHCTLLSCVGTTCIEQVPCCNADQGLHSSAIFFFFSNAARGRAPELAVDPCHCAAAMLPTRLQANMYCGAAPSCCP